MRREESLFAKIKLCDIAAAAAAQTELVEALLASKRVKKQTKNAWLNESLFAELLFACSLLVKKRRIKKNLRVRSLWSVTLIRWFSGALHLP